MTSHLEILDGISQEKSKLPARLSEKCKEYCNNLTLTIEDRMFEFGEDHKFVKCQDSNKCVLEGQICNGIVDCPN